MNGYYQTDPMTHLKRGQTVKEIVDAAIGEMAPAKKPKRPMGEDRKAFLRLMGLKQWIR